MRSYNTFTKIALSLLTLNLAACNLPTPKNKDGKGTDNQVATFTAQAMADKSKAMEVSVQGPFSLPSSKTFNLQACVTDVAYSKPILGHDFLIEEINQKVTSDKSGCLAWSENIDFNFLANPQYILIERHILGKGLHKGSQRVAFAINPWSDGSSAPAILNPDDNKIEKLVSDKQQGDLALKGLSSDNQTITRPLWVETAHLVVTEQKLTTDGIILVVDFKANPSIQMTKMSGETFLRPLTSGNFKSRIKFIHSYQENNREIHRLLAETALLDSSMENGTLAIKSSVTMPAIPTRGQIMLGLELQMVQGPQGLKNFEGVYPLGEYDQIKGTSFLKINASLAKNKDFKLSDFVNSSLAEMPHNLQNGNVDTDTYQKPKIEVFQLEFPNLRIGQEKTSTREIFYSIKACIRHGVDSKTTRAQTFKITKFRQSEQESEQSISIKTDNNSCLTWDESFTFKYFDCQHFFKGFFQIENPDLGMKEKFEIVLNPWETGGAIARDMRYVDPAQKLALNCQTESRPKTQIFIDGYSYNTLSYNYSVDQFLNLTVTKKIQLKMEPRLLMYSSLSGGRGEAHKLRDGVYLLRTAIVQNQDYDTNNTYVTSADRIVNVIDGQINTDLSFQTQDLKALGNRNNILVEIYPIDENKVDISAGNIKLKNSNDTLESAIDLSTGLSTPTFIGPITLNTDDSSRPLRMIDASAISQILLNGKTPTSEGENFVIQKLVAQGLNVAAERKQKIQELANINNFAVENNLDLISLKGADEKAPLVKSIVGSTKVNEVNLVSKADLQELVTSGKLSPQTAHKLCAFWVADYFGNLNANKGGTIRWQYANGFTRKCMTAVDKDPSAFFKIENQVRVSEVGGSWYLKGLNQGLSVGTSFSLSKSYSESKSNTHSLNFGIKAGTKVLNSLLEVGGGYGYSLSWSTSDSDSSSNSISVSGSTSMAVQQNIFKIRLNKYEQCAIVRMNPKLFIKDTKWFGLLGRDYLNILNPRLTEEEKATTTKRGLMLCSGEIKNEPKDIIENYYLLAQETGSTQMQDSGDARNRNFFIALRSKNDFNRFVLAIKGTANTPRTSDRNDDAQEQETKTMEQLFQMSGPTYPGTYLLQ